MGTRSGCKRRMALVAAAAAAAGSAMSILFACCPQGASGFYLPGTPPHDFKKGEEVLISTNSLTSTKTQIPMPYYSLPFCKIGSEKVQGENLGEVLAGDRITSIPYDVRFAELRGCETLCAIRPTDEELGKFATAIKDLYVVNLISDNLPGVVKSELAQAEGEDNSGAITALDSTIVVDQGYALGFAEYPKSLLGSPKGSDDSSLKNEAPKYYINNHLQIEFAYNSKNRIVEFNLYPLSVKHEFLHEDVNEESPRETPLQTCNARKIPDATAIPQGVSSIDDLNSGFIFFTYDVEWKFVDAPWANRWKVYFQSSDPDASIHWFHIISSALIVLMLTGVTALILTGILYRDIATYKNVRSDEDVDDGYDIEDGIDDFDDVGWKLLHGNVFRPPPYAMALSVLVASGTHILVVTIALLSLASFGVLSPSLRGALISAVVVIYVLSTAVSGYVGARLYKFMDGKNWKTSTVLTATTLPAIVFSIVLLVNNMLWAEGSTLAIPFSTMLAVMAMFLLLSVPLAFMGSFFGIKQDKIHVINDVDKLPRHIPPLPWWTHTVLISLATGALPFACVFVEYYFVLSAIWNHQIYYVFGFMLLVVILLIICSAEVAIVVVYFYLSALDYRWWWNAFLCTSMSGVHFFLYSIVYFCNDLSMPYFVSAVYYFSYMAIASLLFGLMTGAIGVIASFGFIATIYRLVKSD